MNRPTSFVILALLAAASVASAQSDLEKFNRQLELLRRERTEQAPKDVPVGQRALLDYGAYFTFDYLSIDDSNHDNHVLRQYDAVAYARLNFDGAHEFFLRGRATYRDFNPDDSFSGRGDELLDPDLDRAYYRFDLARSLGAYRGERIDSNLVLQTGRDLVYWGNGLVLGQVLDGAAAELSTGPLSVQLLAGVTPIRTVDIDSSRPGFDYHTRRGFYGALASAQLGTHRPFAYGLIQRDSNRDDVYSLPPISTRFEYNSYYLGVGSTGGLSDRLLYGLEFVYEGGNTLSNSFEINPPFLSPVPQTKDRISAFAIDLKLDYLFGDAHLSRLTGELIAASGDDDRLLSASNTFGGNKPGTPDHAFNAFGLQNTGFAFAPTVSNIVIVRAGASTFPLNQLSSLRHLQIGADLFAYTKASRSGPIDEPTSPAGFLGWEPDVYLNWRVTSDLTVALRYGIFFPQSDAFGSDEPRQFFSTSMTVGF